jgi:hypothetical protein
MRNQKPFVLGIFIVFMLACMQTAVLGQSANGLANVSGGGSSVKWDVIVQHSGGTLTISAPDGRVFYKEFRAGASPDITLTDKQLDALPDGTYSYELRLRPVLTPGAREALKVARGKDDDPEGERAGRKRAVAPAVVQSGSFSILNGSIVVAGGIEGQRRAATTTEPQRTPGVISGNTATRLRNHRLSLFSMPDQVIADDLIVQGSTCVGLDCVNNEAFGFDTIRLKENNDRIQFDDTSTSAGFPTNNWQIRANSSASGGASFLAFVDQGATGNSETGTILFEVDAGAPANSLKVSSTGKVGIKTGTPVLDLHIAASDTPAQRLEQTTAGGFSAQTWDIAGNEANFFVRDVTGGSRLPFRIRPGAPTSSIDINASGQVGVGTASPAVNLDVRGSNAKIQIGTETAGFFGASQTGLGVSNGTEKFFAVVQTGGGFFGTISNSPFGLVANNNTRVTISGAGAVQFNNYGAGTLVTDASGNITASSDERIKKNIRPFNRGLREVLGLKPILYGYTKDSGLDQTRNDYVGFTAQNVQAYIPEAVGQDSRGVLSLTDRPIIDALVNAVKEQQMEIAELKGQVQKLRAASHRRKK